MTSPIKTSTLIGLILLACCHAWSTDLDYWVVRDSSSQAAHEVWSAHQTTSQTVFQKGRFSGEVGVSAYWLLIPKDEFRASSFSDYFILESALIDQIELWIINGDTSHLLGVGGDRRPLLDRVIKSPHLVFPMEHVRPFAMFNGLAIRISTHDGLYETVRPILISEGNMFKWLSQRIIWPCILTCILFLLSFVSAISYVILQKRLFLYFLGYTLSFGLWVFEFHGLGDYFFFPSIAIGNQWLQATVLLFICFISLFGMELLKINTKHKAWSLLVKGGILMTVLGGVPLFVMDHYRLFFSWIIPWSCLSVFTLLAFGVKGVIMKDRDARFFIGTWLLCLIGGLSYSAKVYGLLPSNEFTEKCFELGVVAQAFAIAIGVSYRVYDEQRRMNEILENEVLSRTLELQSKNQQLEILSTIDPLTGLYNRRKFNELFLSFYHQSLRNKSFLSLMMIDVDYFKRYNDHYGHLNGDEILKKVAGVLENAVRRPSDFCCRYGGEEFLVCLVGSKKEGAEYVGKKIMSQIENLKIPHERSEHHCLTLSIGVAEVVIKHGIDVEDALMQAIKKADHALYTAKNHGRNQIVA